MVVIEPMHTVEIEKKVLLVGEGGVGKTSLIRRYVLDRFDDRYIVTIGTKVTRKTVEVERPVAGARALVMLSIWDIIGQQGAERAHRLYFSGAEGVLLVVDGTRRSTFDAAGGWAKRVRSACGPVPGVLACNKSDLRDKFEVKDGELARGASTLGLEPMYTSAKTGEGVERAFRSLAEKLAEPVLAGRGGR